MPPITLLHRGAWSEAARRNLERMVASDAVGAVIALLPPGSAEPPPAMAGVPVTAWHEERPDGGVAVARVLDRVSSPYLLQVEAPGGLFLVPHVLERMFAVADASGALLTYGDFHEREAGAAAGGSALQLHPLADHQEGSLGDRFDFGPLRLWSTAAMSLAAGRYGSPSPDLLGHAWYDLRLKGSLVAPLVRLPEPLAIRERWDDRASGAAVFDYLTAERALQREAERIATDHLRRVGAHVQPPFEAFESAAAFPIEATVVIPVRDRVLTIADAVDSALSQIVPQPFNVIVVDNHSGDGTTELLAEKAAADDRLIHVIPDRSDLGIGGCWNAAIYHPACGRYAVQLDSDDLYEGSDTLARMVAALRDGRCGMAVGSYTTVDLSLSPVAPGLVDHREWTENNGPNNALRIEGLGAPRGFATELVRGVGFPNVSYGEDYAVALRISGRYRVARIFDSLYLCRRWEENTDADLSPELVARHQTYKDRVRTLEIAARRRRNGPREGGA